MVPEISVIIPCRDICGAETTLGTLCTQTFKDFSVTLIYDRGRGANWARNRGFEATKSPYVLFSDDDIRWEPKALEQLYDAIHNQYYSFSYGYYEMNGLTLCNREWDKEAIKKDSFVSSMSLFKRDDFCGWDENIKRLQDWDVALTMMENGKTGKFTRTKIFTTTMKPGISEGGQDLALSDRIIRQKHGL
jgi:glycosyltransferase involved in cell wall biosynthesis